MSDYVPPSDRVVALIKEHGLTGLGLTDGCWCLYFSVLNVHVDVSCHKSSHTIRVYSHSIDWDGEDLQKVMQAVVEDLSDPEKWVDVSEYRLRFCEERYDRKNECCYCGKPRLNPEAYLCQECETRPEATRSFPWKFAGFRKLLEFDTSQ